MDSFRTLIKTTATFIVLLLDRSGASTALSATTVIRNLSQDIPVISNCDVSNLYLDDDLDGVLLVKGGSVVAEWRNPLTDLWRGATYKEGTTQHAMQGVTKTIVSALVGMLYRDGFLNWITQHPNSITLGDIFPNEGVWENVWDIPYILHDQFGGGTRRNISLDNEMSSKVKELKALTLGEVLSMRTGYTETPLGFLNEPSLQQELNRLVAWWHPLYRAGAIESQTCFECANYLSNSAIVHFVIQHATKTPSNPLGWDPLTYARQTSETLPNGHLGLFQALGMSEGSYTWDTVGKDDMVRDGLWMDLKDMAKFGQLLFQNGQVLWHDNALKEVIPNYYFEEMTKTQAHMTGSLLPYGWNIWTSSSGYCAEGLGWQSVCIYPDHDMVVTIQSSQVWNVDAFVSNLSVRNAAVEKAIHSIKCFESPNDNALIPSSPTGAPTMPLIQEGSAVSDTRKDEKEKSDFYFGKDIDGTNIPLGLVITLALALSMVSVLTTLLCCYCRQQRKQEGLRSSSQEEFCKAIPPSAFDEANKLQDDGSDTDDEEEGLHFM